MDTISLIAYMNLIPRKWTKRYGALRESGNLIRPAAIQTLNEYAATLPPKGRERIRIANVIRDAGGPE